MENLQKSDERTTACFQLTATNLYKIIILHRNSLFNKNDNIEIAPSNSTPSQCCKSEIRTKFIRVTSMLMNSVGQIWKYKNNRRNSAEIYQKTTKLLIVVVQDAMTMRTSGFTGNGLETCHVTCWDNLCAQMEKEIAYDGYQMQWFSFYCDSLHKFVMND